MATRKGKSGSPKKQNAVPKQSILKQFEGLNTNDPGQWPLVPRVAAYIAAVIAVIVAAWFIVIATKHEELTDAETRESTLKRDYSEKLAQAVNLDALLEQQATVQRYVEQLERQLPSKAYMDTLLRDISAAGLGNNLEFEKLNAEPIITRDYYAEQPISIVVTGQSYDDFARFASDLARLPRIVTLDNITLRPLDDIKLGDGAVVTLTGLRLTATLKTYRYMTDEEQAENRQAAAQNRR